MTGSTEANREDIAAWQAEMYIYSCYLYDNGYEHPLDDHSYTAVWENVKYYYPYLPEDLKQRIPYKILDTPSSIGLAQLGWREEDRRDAFAWHLRVKGKLPAKLA